jgi:N-acetylglucosaminyldiphosphoundecaprenol N-acetyl-beta-D-mannosaminyltransferase
MTEKPPYVMILGVRVDRVSVAGALQILAQLAVDGRPHQVVTVNPEFIMTAQRNARFREVINAADLALPDGIGVVWASRHLGRPATERVAGVDMVRALARFAAGHGMRPFLLGAGPGVAEAAAAALQAENPGLQIAGVYAGSPAPEEEAHIVGLIEAARPDFLFVAYGAPQQDVWIARNQGRLGVPIAMGVGGTLDFITGKSRRAPRWMQSLGLEWLHRLIMEPWRWRRMLALPLFAYRVLTSPTADDEGREGV